MSSPLLLRLEHDLLTEAWPTSFPIAGVLFEIFWHMIDVPGGVEATASICAMSGDEPANVFDLEELCTVDLGLRQNSRITGATSREIDVKFSLAETSSASIQDLTVELQRAMQRLYDHIPCIDPGPDPDGDFERALARLERALA